MKAFELARPRSLEEARELLGQKKDAVFKAGGIDLLDHLKEHLLEPARVVDLRAVPGLDKIEALPDGGLRIGPLTTLSKVAAHQGVRKTHAALAQACGEAASPQIRNVATLGGNLLQRPRCWYYRLESYKCLKKGGDVCFAVNGENRYHVIFGGGPSYAPHPSNAAVALVALNASLVLESDKGPRTVPAGEFFTPPARDPERENLLAPGELLTEIRVPPAGAARSAYDEVRERAAFDWPLVSVAAAVRLEGGSVAEARIVLGAVAPIPWRSTRAEQALIGKALNEASARAAAQAAVVGAAPLSDNGYKVGLVQTLVRRTLLSFA
jgi:xanthine dehydrogenase YagS FAD-binding subunit